MPKAVEVYGKGKRKCDACSTILFKEEMVKMKGHFRCKVCYKKALQRAKEIQRLKV